MITRGAPVKLPKGIADPLAFERIKAVPHHRRRSAPDTGGLQHLDPSRPSSRAGIAGSKEKQGRSRRASQADRFRTEPSGPRSRSSSRGVNADRFKSDPGRPPSRPDSRAGRADGFPSEPGRPQGRSPSRGNTAGGRTFSPGSIAGPKNPDVRGIMARRKSTSVVDLKSTCATDLRNLAVQPLLVEKFPTNSRPPSSHLTALPPRGVSLFEQDRRNSTRSSVNDAVVQPSWQQVAESVLNGDDTPRDANDKVAPDASDESTNGPPSSQNSCLSDQSQIAGMEVRRSSKSCPELGSRTMEDIRDRHIKLSTMEAATTERAFVRFLAPDVSEMERERLQDILIHLGYLSVTEEALDEVADEISGFSTFSYEETLEVIELFAKEERNFLLKAFETHSKRGKMNIQQLTEAMQELKMTPLKATIKEILPIAGGAEQGYDGFMVDLDAFLNFMAMYRLRQGFTNVEVLNAHSVYDEAVSKFNLGGGSPFTSSRRGGASRDEIRVPELTQALLELFGPFLTELVQKQLETVVPEWTADCCQLSPGKLKSTVVPFNEFLVWARRVREAALGEIWIHFERGVTDNSGLLPVDRLGDAMRGLGFTLFSEELDEIAEQADLRKDERIDFDHFVAFVDTCRRCGGFRQKELEEFGVLMKKFDYDKSKEIEKLEFVDLLRHLGYSTSLEDVIRFMEQADSNNNASIDFTEFVWLMRLHRELELTNVRQVFEAHCTAAVQGLLKSACGKALSALDQAPRELKGLGNVGNEKLDEALDDTPEVLTFKDFVCLVDKCRLLVVNERRQRAGFNEEEFDRLQKRFAAHLKPGSQHLERGAFLWLIMEMGVNIKSMEEREDVFSMIDDARRAAIDAGVEPKEVGEFGSQSMTLVAVVHFLNLWRRKYDGQKVVAEEEVIDEARFSRSEVASFRELFVEWVESTNDGLSSEKTTPLATPLGSRAPSKQSTMPTLPEDTGAEAPSLDRRNSMPQLSNLAARRSSLPVMSAIETRKSTGCPPSPTVKSMISKNGSIDINKNQALLPVRTLKQLLSSIGLELDVSQQRELINMIQQFQGSKDSKITFTTFLRVMRWMLDTNFADVNNCTKQIVSRIKPARSGATRASPTAVTDSIEIRIPQAVPESGPSGRRYSIA